MIGPIFSHRRTMGKLFAVTLIIIAIVSAIPIVLHTWAMPEDISTHGHAIDEQIQDTMYEAGFAFLAAQILLGGLIWKFGDQKTPGKLRSFPGGARVLVGAAVLLVGTEILALGLLGQRAWAEVYFAPPAKDAMVIQSQAGQFAFYFRYPGPDGKLGPMHPDKIDEGMQNFFGIDPSADADSKDDIVTGELAIPVNRPIQLLMHSKDVGHSFYVRELRIQQDFVPGVDLAVHFQATKVGKYEIVCTQLCGLGHYNMRAYLTVLSQEDFDKWIADKASQQ
jgi:cytochrome c oxidase subunit II